MTALGISNIQRGQQLAARNIHGIARPFCITELQTPDTIHNACRRQSEKGCSEKNSELKKTASACGRKDSVFETVGCVKPR